MTRKLPLLTLSVVVPLALGAWVIAHHGRSHAPQQVAQTPAQAAEAATSAATGEEPPAVPAGQAAPASSGPVSTAQASDADSTSLEHLAAVPASAALPASAQWKPGVNYDVISP